MDGVSAEVRPHPLGGTEAAGPWLQLEKLAALGGGFLIGSRFEVFTQITAGYLFALVLAPVWLPVVLKLRPARFWFLMVGASLVMGTLLALWRSADHAVSLRTAAIVSLELVGVAAACGFMTWAYTKVGAPQTLISFGLASIVFVNRGSELYSVNPWRFGFAVPVSILVLALAALSRNSFVQLAALAATMVSAALGGGRSTTATQCVALIILLFWLATGRRTTRRRSMAFATLVLGLLAWAVYNIGQALILEGLLGEEARDRSEAQVQTGGGLLLGGRPELGATFALLVSRIWGFGLGAQPNWDDIRVGRTGMAATGFDPLNRYVDTYMFGETFRLHSVLGELWAVFGVAGIVLALCLAWHALAAVASGPRVYGADALMLAAATRTLWNLAFAPWLSSIPMLIILLSLVWWRMLPANGAGDPGHQPTPS